MRELILCSSRKYPQPPPALMEGDGNSEGKGGPKGNNFRGGLRWPLEPFSGGLHDSLCNMIVVGS